MCVEPENSPGVHLKNTRAAPIILGLDRIFGAATPPGALVSFDREHRAKNKKVLSSVFCLGVGDGSRLRSHSPMAKFSSRTSPTDGHAQRMRDVIRRPVRYPPTLFRHLQFHHFTHFPHIVAVVLSAIGEHPGVVPWDCARGQT